MSRLLRCLPLLASLWAGPWASAQDQPGDDLVEEAPPPQAQAAAQVFNFQNFDQWIYGQSIEAARQRCDALLRFKVEAAAQAGNLSAAQQQKLELAGRGDLRRFEERVAALRAKFQQAQQDVNDIQALFQEVQPLSLELRGDLFGPGSLFAKTMRRTLSAEQSAEYARVDLERRTFRYEARVRSVVAQLDLALGLRDAQRQKLIAWLLDRSQPPRQFGPYDQYVIMHQLGRIPEGELAAILDPVQQTVLQKLRERFQGIEPFLQQHGLLPDEGDAPPPDKPEG